MNRHGMDSRLRGARILFVFGNLELGGAERQGLMLADFLKRAHGADVRVMGLQEAPGRLSQLCEEAGIPWQGIRLTWQWGHRHLLANLRELRRVAALLRKEKPDLLMPYTFFPNLICGVVWRFSGARLCIWNQRDEGIFLVPEFWRSLAARMTPYFISNSARGRDALLEAFSISPGKVEVIRNGVSPGIAQSGRREWRERLGVADDSFVACMVANIHAHKDHETLLRAWRNLVSGLPTGLPAPVLLLAGRVDQGDAVKELAASLALHGSVRFLGEIDDVAGLLGAADICMHSSRSEGLPNAVLEAMASGLPVAATDIPGIREAVGPEGYRFLAPAGDPQALADRVGALLLDPALRSGVGELMRERVARRFDVAVACKKTASLIASRWPR